MDPKCWEVATTPSHMSLCARATVITAFLFVFSGASHRAASEPAAAVPFPIAAVHFEQNATDGDMEVVFQVKGDKDGLAELNVVSPDGRPVVAFKAPDASTLGMRQFRFETPEPADFKSLKAAYPEGVYAFSGTTASGAKLAGKATLNHRLPPTTTFTTPAPESENVPVKDFVVAWSAVEDVAAYVVKIDQRELNVNFMVRVPSAWTAFALPDGFLVRGTKYKMAIGTETREGNISYVETTFTTEK
jgi:hypothetical protein